MDNHENMSDGKTSFFLGILVFVLVAIGVVIYVVADIVSAAKETPRSNQDVVATTQRIEPVGKVNLASNPNPDLGKVVEVATASVEFSAETAYNNACLSCHGAGILGAPKFGDKGQWAGRISQGLDTLYASAINGKGAMPAQGGGALSDDQLKVVVDYMIDNAK